MRFNIVKIDQFVTVSIHVMNQIPHRRKNYRWHNDVIWHLDRHFAFVLQSHTYKN
jgi:hypothetical protein